MQINHTSAVVYAFKKTSRRFEVLAFVLRVPRGYLGCETKLRRLWLPN